VEQAVNKVGRRDRKEFAPASGHRARQTNEEDAREWLRANGLHDVANAIERIMLLVLLDGIAERGQIFVLVTTNRPEHIDPALRRPGRFDQVVWMEPPDERGRAKIFEHYLSGLKLDPRVTSERLASELASVTQGLTAVPTSCTYASGWPCSA
jgi:ATP-dependent 26S proteasome regulatory subunit